MNASDDSLEGVAQSPQRGLALWQLAASASPQHQAPGADGHARLTDLGTSPSTPAPLLSSSAPSVHTPPGSVTAGAPPRASLLRTSAASSPSAALPSCRALIIPSHMWGVGSLLPAHMWGVGSLVPAHTHTHTHTQTHTHTHTSCCTTTASTPLQRQVEIRLLPCVEEELEGEPTVKAPRPDAAAIPVAAPAASDASLIVASRLTGVCVCVCVYSLCLVDIWGRIAERWRIWC